MGYFMERRLPFHLVKRSLNYQWRTKAGYTITYDENHFSIRFNNGKDGDSILKLGRVLFFLTCKNKFYCYTHIGLGKS